MRKWKKNRNVLNGLVFIAQCGATVKITFRFATRRYMHLRAEKNDKITEIWPPFVVVTQQDGKIDEIKSKKCRIVTTEVSVRRRSARECI